MKPFLPILTAVLGFSAAWFLKPAPPAAVVIAEKPQPRPAPAPATEIVSNSEPAPEPSAPRSVGRPVSPQTAVDTTEVAQPRDSAKLLRLVEALNLSPEQQDKLLKAIADAQASLTLSGQSASDPAQNLAATLGFGAMIEKLLADILAPEQAAAFAALRKRNQENAVENAAQAQLSSNLKQIDLTPDQRAQALQRLRDSLETRNAAQPAGLDLALESSVLPLGPAAVSIEGIKTLEIFAAAANDPTAAQESRNEILLKDLQNQLELYQGILSPAQEIQLKAQIEERKKTINRIAEIIR